MAGRKTKLTPEVQQKICDALRNCLSRESAAALAGINQDTFYDWMKRGGNGQPLFSEFSESVLAAESEAEQSLVVKIKESDPKWILERRHPDRWTSKRNEGSGSNELIIKIAYAQTGNNANPTPAT